MTLIRPRWAAVLLLNAAIGCGQTDGIKLVPVIGTVTRGGKPVVDATLSFVPEPTNKQSTPGTASSGPTGYYSAMYQTRSGLAPGDYRVLISLDPSTGPVPEEFKNDPMMAQLAAAAKKPSASNKATPIKSSFMAKLDEKGGTFDFDIGPATAGTEAKK